VVLAATWVGGWPFTLVWLAAGIAMALEGLDMARARPRNGLAAVSCMGMVLVTVLTALALPAVAALCALLTLVALAAVGGSTRDRLWAVAAWIYAAIAVCVPIAVREWFEPGLAGILWMFAVVWTTDIAAFFTGRRLGGPKLWPRVSPGKTWSGFAGGLVGATLAGLLVAVLWARAGHALPVGLGAAALASAIASVASQLGDLGESALKRLFAVKDSGRLIPGHGGVMDRLDGFVAVSLLVGLALLGARLVGAQS
jgi:phosphatidate cytidylyltransferase